MFTKGDSEDMLVSFSWSLFWSRFISYFICFSFCFLVLFTFPPQSVDYFTIIGNLFHKGFGDSAQMYIGKCFIALNKQ